MFISLLSLLLRGITSIEKIYVFFALLAERSFKGGKGVNTTHQTFGFNRFSDVIPNRQLSAFCNGFMFWYRGIHEKGSGDVVSAIFYTTYTIHLSLCTQTAEMTSPEPFSRNPLYIIRV